MAAFIKKIDSLFDIFNSSSLLESKLSKCALIEDSPSLDYIKMMKCTFNHLALNVGKCPPMPWIFMARTVSTTTNRVFVYSKHQSGSIRKLFQCYSFEGWVMG